MRNVALLVSLVSILSVNIASAGETQPLGKIVVTPSRLETTNASNAKSVAVIEGAAFNESVYRAIPDLIGNIGGVDIRRRGPEGVQTDINIRGTTFEQNTVLIDGVSVSDPQTGHHNMDLPVTAQDIERIEMLKGPASSLYGANAFGGVINIITKRPREDKVIIETEGGSHDYYKGALSVSYPVGMFGNRFSFEESRSTGYMPETEFDITSLSNATSVETGAGVYDILFGYTKKDFGAGSFYSNLYPDEEEHTDTRFFSVSGTAESGTLKMTPKLFLRRHKDKFALDRNRPGWQTNYHTTYDYGGALNFGLENECADAAYGFELSRDTIDSTNTQTHERGKGGLYVEISPHLFEKLYVNIGLREDFISVFGWQHSPSVSAAYATSDSFKIRSSIGKAYRMPTFTDLYYADAANIGNPDLHPEYCWSYEAGADYATPLLNCSATYFYRNSYDTIDWTRSSSRDPWRVSNIGDIDTNGFESSLEFFPAKAVKELPIEKIYVTYTALDSYRKHDYLSKYALDYLKQQVSSSVVLDIYGFKNSWTLNYKKRIGDSGFIVIDTRVTKEIFRKDKAAFSVFLDICNLFDVKYSEQSNIPMPGRWFKSGARLEL